MILDPINAFTQLIDPLDSPVIGPLKGYKFAVKDVFEVKNFCLQAGNPTFFNQSPIAAATAPSVVTLQNAGATLIGKTHTDELGGSLFGLNAHYPCPLNAYSPTRVPGGSSSGSAAAVAAGLVDFALGADTSGSVRAPASFCGIYGFRPTLGRITTTGVLPISEHLDTVGVFARHPDVISEVLEAYGMEEQTRLTRLRVVPSLINALNPSLKDPFSKKLELFQMLTASNVPFILEEDTLTEWRGTIRTIAMYGLWQIHKEWILRENPTFGDLIQERLTMASQIEHSDYKRALKEQQEIRKLIEDSLQPEDIVVFPTVHDVPPLLSSPLAELKDFALKAARHTCTAALSGCPEMTLPLRDIQRNCALGISFLVQKDQDHSLSTFVSKAHTLMEHSLF